MYIRRASSPSTVLWAFHTIQPSSFGNEFLFICNHCGAMAAWSRKTLRRIDFLPFLEKRPLTEKFLKFCSERIHRDTNRRVVFKFRETWLVRNRWNRVWLIWETKEIGLAVCPDLATERIAPKICQAMFSVCSRFHPKRQHRQSALQSESNIRPKPSFELNNYIYIYIYRVTVT